MNTTETEESNFNIIRKEPLARDEMGELLMISAKLHLDEIIRITSLNDSIESKKPNRRAAIGCYMMLCGLAIENFAKGKLSSDQTSHSISKIVPKLINHLSVEESDLLLRLEHYSIWAGRYMIPNKKEDYDSSIGEGKLGMNSKDPELIKSLIVKIRSVRKTSLIS